MGAQNVEVIAATPSLPVVSLNGPGWGSRMDRIVPTIRRAGYGGLQVWPHYRLTESIVESADSDAVRDWVHSTHQAGRVSGIRGRLMGLFVPDSIPSVGKIKKIQTALPKQGLAILFSDTVLREEFKDDAFTEENTGTPLRAAQPSPEVYRDFGIEGWEAYLEEMDESGVPYHCDDAMHHYRSAADGTRIPDAENARQHFLASGRTIQMHVPGDRSDLADRDPELAAKSRESARVFVEGKFAEAKDTWLGRLVIDTIENVQLAPEAGGVLSIVPEHLPRLYSTAGEFISTHEPFVERIQQLAQHAGATVMPQPALPRGLA